MIRSRSVLLLMLLRGTGRPSAFRIKDHRAGPATEVSLAAQRCVVHADGRPRAWM
jgi:hypothetical protein